MDTKTGAIIGAGVGIAILLLWPKGTEAGKGSLTGVVTDEATGNPIAGATVVLESLNTSTNSSGGYSFNNIEPGNYLVTVSKTGYTTKGEQMLINAGANTLDVVMTVVTIDNTLTGTVTDSVSGLPISGVTVTIQNATDITDASGQFGFTGLQTSPPNWPITFTKAGYTTRTL